MYHIRKITNISMFLSLYIMLSFYITVSFIGSQVNKVIQLASKDKMHKLEVGFAVGVEFLHLCMPVIP